MTNNIEIEISSISGTKIKIHPFGARIISWEVPYQEASIQIVESYEDINHYKNKRGYSNATIGPFANRIKQGQFVIKGETFDIDKNEGKNSLHSGCHGLHQTVWKIIHSDIHEVTFEKKVGHLEDGFPGNRIFRTSYSLEEDDLHIGFEAESDTTTHVSLTNHSYFNLDTKEDLSSHLFMIAALGVLELDDEKIPTGKILEGYPYYDLNQFQELANRTFDHNFLLKDYKNVGLAAAAYCSNTDLTLEVYTDQPGLQFYTGNKAYFAMETQHFPNSPNEPSFPSTLVDKGRPYKHQCIYRVVR